MQILLEIVSELIKISGMLISAIAIRWLMDLSTPTRDWHTVKMGAEWFYDSIRIPDWREWFNMERLTRLRNHPDAAVVWDKVVDGTLYIAQDAPSESSLNAKEAQADGEELAVNATA